MLAAHVCTTAAGTNTHCVLQLATASATHKRLWSLATMPAAAMPQQGAREQLQHQLPNQKSDDSEAWVRLHESFYATAAESRVSTNGQSLY